MLTIEEIRAVPLFSTLKTADLERLAQLGLRPGRIALLEPHARHVDEAVGVLGLHPGHLEERRLGAAQVAVHEAVRRAQVSDPLAVPERVGLEVDASTQRTIRRGRVMREALRQPRFTNRRLWAQILTLTTVSSGWLDELAPDRVHAVMAQVVERMHGDQPAIVAALDAGQEPQADWIGGLHDIVDAELKRAAA